ncbi:bacillithiol biosynthesis cysteine-adding enzyme BshC [Spongiivirga citrea]|uniref:Putative cysteine ligase BshC n=1 Tax=Spongiivirga citrea TaxID=1481457 RepID=A0A6M0CNX3_9FLAO|nr:bacillithiol biosynthesis cysteine-adding enzyme BshC [Spongiivirga citrea]NER17754.1 bacillithiol biosynthesis cysteine-adding enzyme BshC [Spongiivirga citrea]
MPSDCIDFKATGYFSSLICDYLEEKAALKPFYNRFPNADNFLDQIKEKQDHFLTETRTVLHNVLQSQYKGFSISEGTQQNINLLKSNNTFTITTGHQLNLFTGPLYFLYKIISTINLCRELSEKHRKYNFVPVYWMATEDHDFDEINYFNFKGKKIQWNRPDGGAVGEFDTKGLDTVLEAYSAQLGGGKNADQLRKLFEDSYLKHDSLTDATRHLANTLFGEYGLVIIDGNDSDLKRLFIPHLKEELLEQTSFKVVSKSIDAFNKLEGGYKVQVNPREINLFYLDKGIRERLIEQDGEYLVNDQSIKFSKEGILSELNSHPEKFSPNVILRPLYQEVILPNLCYIGGGGELAYWLELKDMFEAFKVPFPMLLLRNSVLVKTEKQAKKQDSLEINDEELFLKRDSFINRKVRQISNITIDFSEQRALLKSHFESMFEVAKLTDQSFEGAVKAQEVKQLKGLDHLEKRLLKAQKKKLKDQVGRMTDLQEQLFPGQSLQERNLNFSELYLEHGEKLIAKLIKELDPLSGKFLILSL